MKIFLTTVAGSATRFSESVGKPTVKCIYNREDPKKTLLNHMLTQAEDYDVFVIVGGFLIGELGMYIDEVLTEEQKNKVILVDNKFYKEYGSGWSLYLGVKAVFDKFGTDFDEILFAEGDLFVDDESMNSVMNTSNSVITINSEAIKAKKDGADYLGVGAIYAPPSKPDAKVTGKEIIQDIKDKTGLPVVAIGGINIDNCRDIMNAGADSVAVISAVLSAPSPLDAAIQLIKKIGHDNEQ